MGTFEIDPVLEAWVNEVAVPECSEAGVCLTIPAAKMIGILLQTQIDEGLVQSKEQALARAKQLLDYILVAQKALRKRNQGMVFHNLPHGRGPLLTANRILHLITHANAAMRCFPWETTMEFQEMGFDESLRMFYPIGRKIEEPEKQ